MARKGKETELSSTQKKSTGASEVAPKGVVSHESSFMPSSPDHTIAKKKPSEEKQGERQSSVG